MSTYTIGEVAERSGFSASALRYYEGIGLVVPATRTDAGYRQYDDRTLARLAFISRAKQLGCSLDEITDLVGIWDAERCAPVQRRFHELVTDKIRNAHLQITELTAFADQLESAATQLAGEPIDGPCNDDCACVSAGSRTASPVPPAMGVALDDRAVAACTLEVGAMPDRLAEWKAVHDHARSRTIAADGSLRVEFDDDLALDELARLVRSEQECCAFFSFAITVDARGVALEVRAPEDAKELVTAVFGRPA